MNEHEKYSKLKETVENFVKDKIRDVENVDEIISLCDFGIDEPEYENTVKSYEQLYRYKKMLQLTLNLYNNFELYKGYAIKLIPVESTISSPIHKYYQRDPSNDLWTCFDRPMDGDVIEALYNYLLCFLSIERQNRKGNIVKCFFCDNDVAKDLNKCNTCNATKTEILQYNRRSDTSYSGGVETDKIERSDTGECNTNEAQCQTSLTNDLDERNYQNVTPGNDDQSDHSVQEIFKKDCMTDESMSNAMLEGNSVERNECHILVRDENDDDCTRVDNQSESTRTDNNEDNVITISNDDKWPCAACGYLNDNNVWLCKICFQVSDVRKSQFEDTPIGKKMSDIVENSRSDDGQQRKNQWKCSKCDTWQGYDVIHCVTCKDSRTVCGKWECDWCTLMNVCADEKCAVCEAWNDQLVVKYCTKCKVQIVTTSSDFCDWCVDTASHSKDSSVKWRCTIGHCSTWNQENVHYCCKCKIWRFSSRNRGDPVKRRSTDGDKSVWICVNCYRQNDLSQSVCVHSSCGESRYKDTYCYNCREYNHGLSISCLRCHRRL